MVGLHQPRPRGGLMFYLFRTSPFGFLLFVLDGFVLWS